MPHNLTIKTLIGLDQFVKNSERWNALWESSEAYQAVARCDAIEHWVRTFGKAEDFRAVVVESSTGEYLGGIAFVIHAGFGLKKLSLPVNHWVNCGELMIARQADPETIIGLIVDQLKLEGDFLEFDQVQFEAARWQAFVSRLQNMKQTFEISRVQRVGMIDIGDNWDDYFRCLSGNHRSAVRRSEKKIHKSGDVQLLRLNNPQDDELRIWMQRAFEVEHRSWKGANGTSILAAGMDEYFLQEAINARDCGMLELWFLLLNDQPIAFEYCHLVKDNCHSYKIGYDEAFREFSPGRLLRKMQLEHLTEKESPAEPMTFALDTMGLLCATKSKWVTRDYRICRMTASLSIRGNFFVKGQGLLRRAKGKIRPQHDEQSDIKLGGAGFLSGDDKSTNKPT